MIQEVGVFAETLSEFRVGEEAQLLEELAIEAGRRRGTRASRAPRARGRTALRRDAPDPRTSAPPASRRRRFFFFRPSHTFLYHFIRPLTLIAQVSFKLYPSPQYSLICLLFHISTK